MTVWRCLALTRDGQMEWRQIDAPDRSAAAAMLAQEGLVALQVRGGAATFMERLNQPVAFSQRLSLSEQALVLMQLATLVTTGLPVDRSLDLLRDQAPRARQRQLLGRALIRVRGGEGLGAALGGLQSFPDYVIGVVKAAERGGGLGPALTSVAHRLNRTAATRRSLLTALTYPAAVLVASLSALMLVLTTVVPQFATVFEGEEDRLPGLTRAVLALSKLVTGNGTTLLACMAAAVALLILLFRSSAFGGFLHRHGRLVPGVGLRDQYLAAQFTGVFGTLLGNGLNAVAALPLARNSVGSTRWRGALKHVERQISEGARLSAALGQVALIPSTAVRLIEVGERSGRLSETCLQASEILGAAVQARIDRIVSLANPIAIILLGGIVGALVGGVMLGIFSVGDLSG